MIDDLLWSVITMLVVLIATVARPTVVRAPRGWFVEGVRPNGSTTIRPSPPPNCGEPVPPYDQPCPDDPRAIGARVYCTNGTRPIVVDERTVGCQRRYAE